MRKREKGSKEAVATKLPVVITKSVIFTSISDPIPKPFHQKQ